jgi:hypothetical protein
LPEQIAAVRGISKIRRLAHKKSLDALKNTSESPDIISYLIDSFEIGEKREDRVGAMDR